MKIIYVTFKIMKILIKVLIDNFAQIKIKKYCLYSKLINKIFSKIIDEMFEFLIFCFIYF